MKRVLRLLLTVIVMTAGASIAFGQDPHHQIPPPGGLEGPGAGQMRMQFQMPTFSELDKNKDKKLSREEMPAQFPPQVFDRIDTNRDGLVDEEEWNGMRARFGAGSTGGGAGGTRMGESLTKLLDGNADAKVSRDEFAKILTLFDALDKDHSGELTTEELTHSSERLLMLRPRRPAESRSTTSSRSSTKTKTGRSAPKKWLTRRLSRRSI
jgi:Ca2+-binding EF-hand superfamily protein